MANEQTSAIDVDADYFANILPENHPYIHLKYLNSGTHGVVCQAEDADTGELVALKFLKRGPRITNYVEREILNQLRLRHPHVVALKEVFLAKQHLVLVMELAAGGNLHKFVVQRGRLSEDDARCFFQQLMFSIDYCHRVGVCNRDIKLENLLLASADVRPLIKLSDFGFSKDEHNQSAPDSLVGTPAYLPPEVIANMQGHSYDAKKADVWSCGVVLFVMLTGHLPFARQEDKQQPSGTQLHMMLQRILEARYSFPTTCVLTNECMGLISRMLVKDPLQRLSVREVLAHPWCRLQPHVLAYNDSLVATSLANPLPKEVVEQVTNLLRDARRPEHMAQEQVLEQTAIDSRLGGTSAGGGGGGGSSSGGDGREGAMTGSALLLDEELLDPDAGGADEYDLPPSL